MPSGFSLHDNESKIPSSDHEVNAETNKNLQFKQMTNLFHSGSSLTASLVEFTNLVGCYNKEKGSIDLFCLNLLSPTLLFSYSSLAVAIGSAVRYSPVGGILPPPSLPRPFPPF